MCPDTPSAPPPPPPAPEPPQEPEPLVVVDPVQQIPNEDEFNALSPLDVTHPKKERLSEIFNEINDRAFNSLLEEYEKGERDDATGAPTSSLPNLEDEVFPNLEMLTSLTTCGVGQELNFKEFYAPERDAKPTSPSAKMVGAGIYNLGSTCFLGVILQSLTHTVSLVRALRNGIHNTPCSLDGFCVICAFREHIETSIASSGLVVWPLKLADKLSYFSDEFVKDKEQDAHEFLQSALRKLKECLPDGVDDNIVEAIFENRLITKVRCPKCFYTSDTSNPIMDISLPIENVNTILQALESFTDAEFVDELSICERCRQFGNKERQLMLDLKASSSASSSVLILHLNRFKMVRGSTEKISKHVQFPLELDMLPYSSRKRNLDMLLYTSDKRDDVLFKYNLYAIVVHSGSSLESGHYYCFVRSTPDQWYEFNDSEVSDVCVDKVKSQEAYILFYAVQGTPWFSSIMESTQIVSENKDECGAPPPHPEQQFPAKLVGSEIEEENDPMEASDDDHLTIASWIKKHSKSYKR